jgi:hypothetical protein
MPRSYIDKLFPRILPFLSLPSSLFFSSKLVFTTLLQFLFPPTSLFCHGGLLKFETIFLGIGATVCDKVLYESMLVSSPFSEPSTSSAHVLVLL